ncbi:MAG: redoxin domain-containing protein, partial [Candidatus Hydrogenedentes bacterium]|nr:redoxin domain-containing protein [Candidatus Hydrogenedentota bacterium]
MKDTTPPKKINLRRFSWETLLVGVVLGIALFVGGIFAILLGSYTFFRKEAVTKMAELKELKPLLLRADLDWSVKDLNGDSVDLKAFEGQPLLLHFWNPTCVSCIAEIPSLNTLYD